MPVPSLLFTSHDVPLSVEFLTSHVHRTFFIVFLPRIKKRLDAKEWLKDGRMDLGRTQVELSQNRHRCVRLSQFEEFELPLADWRMWRNISPMCKLRDNTVRLSEVVVILLSKVQIYLVEFASVIARKRDSRNLSQRKICLAKYSCKILFSAAYSQNLSQFVETCSFDTHQRLFASHSHSTILICVCLSFQVWPVFGQLQLLLLRCE